MAFGRLGTFGTGFGRLGHAPRTPWWLAGSSLDMDFVKNRARQAGLFYMPSALLSTTRASVGYADNTAGVYSSFASNIPRITDLGLLVEEARTNSIRNNSMQGAVAGVIGSGGAYSTNWANNTSGAITGLTYTVGLTTIFGVDVLSLRAVGTPGATGQIRIAFDTTTQIVANTGETWVLSAFLALLAGSYTNIGQIRLTHQERDAGGTSLRGTASSDMKASIGATLSRLSFAATMGASTARNQPEVMIDVTSGQAIDLTIAIGWPQLELGAFATSPIRTTSAAATRAADAITVNGFTPGAVGTVFVDGGPNYASGSAINVLVSLDDATGNNRLQIRKDQPATATMQLSSGGVSQGSSSVAGWSDANARKLAVAYAADDLILASNGTLGTQDTLATIPTLTRMAFGSAITANSNLNGYLRRVAYFPTRLTNAQLQAITQ